MRDASRVAREGRADAAVRRRRRDGGAASRSPSEASGVSAGRGGGGRGAPDASAAERISQRQRKGDDGARACALRALEAFARVQALSRSVLKAKNGLTVLAETANGTNGESATVRKLASDVLTALGV